MSPARFAAGVLAVALLFAAGGLRGGDPASARAMWQWAERRAPNDPTDPAWIDAAREMSEVRPWQPGYPAIRKRLHAVEAARDAMLGGASK